MDFDGIGTMALFLSTGAVGVCLVFLAGYRMKLKADIERARLGGHSADDVGELRAELESTLAHQTRQIDELHERLDFTERLLTRGRTDQQP
ncbi:MAG TPA: hypothetical protein VGA37_14700 [Gemmatimonadales bacterium]